MLFYLMAGNLELEVAWQQNLDEVEVYRARVVAASEDGTVALIDRDQRHVVLLNDAGELKHRISAQGQGPGEMQNPVEITYCAWDKTFAVLDFGNVRLLKWDTSGKFHSEHPLPRNFFRPHFGAAKQVFLLRDPFGLEQSDPTLLRMDLAEGAPTTVWNFKTNDPIVFSTIGRGPEASNIVWRWNPALVYGLGKEFLAVGFGREPIIHLLNFKGEAVRQQIAVKLPRYPVTDAQIEAAFDLMPANMSSDLRAGLVKPDSWPVIRTVLVDGMDRIWVVGAAPDLGKAHPYVVFSSTGDQLAEGKITALPLAATDKALYYLQGDEDLFLVKAAIKATG